MKKVPNLFQRDWNGDKSRVLAALNPDADVSWVLDGHGTPTVKWDGSAVLIKQGGGLFVRYDAKNGKTPPPGFEPAQDPDPVTGHWPGWIPALGNPAAKWHIDSYNNTFLTESVSGEMIPPGTYEALGPQHQSNPYSFPFNILIKHGAHVIKSDWLTSQFRNASDAYVALRSFLHGYRIAIAGMSEAMGIEGIVWHHESGDGRMVKVLSSDLGVPWRTKQR